MAETATKKSDSKPTVQARSAGLLQGLLVDLVHLQLQTKQAHWNVQGPLFDPIHEFLDQMTDSYRTFSDDVAERIRALEKPADGRISRVARDSRLAGMSADLLSDRDVLKLMDRQLADIIRNMRSAQTELADLDAVSEDLILEILATLEKQAWMIRSQLAE